MANTSKKSAKPSGASKSVKKKEPDIPKKTASKPAQTRAAAGGSSAKSKAAPAGVQTAADDSFGKRQGAGIAFFCLGLFTLAVVLVEGESAWQIIHNALFGAFGFSAFIVPLIFFYLCYTTAKNRAVKSAAVNVVFSGIFVIFLSSVIHLISKEAAYITDTELLKQVNEVWIDPNSKWSGGALGAFVGGAAGKFFGRTGALISVIILAFAAFMFMTGITIPGIVRFFAKAGKKGKEDYSRKAAEREQRRLEREALEEEQRLREEEEAEKALLEESRRRAKTPPSITDNKEEKHPSPSEFNSGSDISIKLPGAGAAVDTLAEPSMPAVVQTAGQAVAAVPASLTVAQAAANAAQSVEVPETPAKKDKRKKPKAEKPEPAEKKQPEPSENGEIRVTSEKYMLPPIDLLELPHNYESAVNIEDRQRQGANKLIETLDSFKIRAEITNIVRGPSVTRYELVPDAGVRISKITSLSDDIALRLAARSVRIEAPIPGKSAIGIEVPNEAKSTVTMREMIDTDEYRRAGSKSKLSVALGKDITGRLILADIAKMPHLLVAGTTGSGKSVCLNSMIVSILYNASPDEVRLVMIDPKQVEFTVYNGIAHLEIPVVSNPRKAAGALGWAVSEMEKRYKLFAEHGVRDIDGFNKLCSGRDDMEKMHRIVIFIDELSDLMMTSPKEVEDSICRLAQMARAAGIHLVIATQRPTADVITGLIKANIPSRIALYVSSLMDSRIILDRGGAEKLLGNGDMLFAPVGASAPTRIQGCYIADDEVERIVNHIKSQTPAEYSDEIMREIDAKAAEAEGKHGADAEGDDILDPMYNQAAEVVIQAGQASTTMLQKKLKLGYARASRVMDQLEETGIVGASEGAKPRQVLISAQEWYERQALAQGGKSDHNVQMSFNDIDNSEEEEELDDIEAVETGDFDEDDSAGDFADIIEDEDEFEDDYEEEETADNYAPEEPDMKPEEDDGFADIYEDDGGGEDGLMPVIPVTADIPVEVSLDEAETGENDTDPPEEIDIGVDEIEDDAVSDSPAESDDDYFDDDDYTDPLINVDDIFAEDADFSDDEDY